MRWAAIMLVLAALPAALVGCKQQCYLTECDFNESRTNDLPPNLESDPSLSTVPTQVDIPAPRTILELDRQPRYLCLSEAIAIALEHGTPGSPMLDGTTIDFLATLQGRTVFSQENSLRVLALAPALAGADIEASLAKFDARWSTSMLWQRTNQPIGGNILTDLQNGDQATFSTGLQKPLPTGGVAGITFTTVYTFLSEPPAGVVNPSYRPTLQFAFEQPLLQGFGVEINQLRAQHPGSVLNPFPLASRVEGILITRIRFDQQRADFERQLHTLLANVEVAYWNLYGAYGNLYARSLAQHQSYIAWRITLARLQRGIRSPDDLAQARGQYELFRGTRLQALAQVLLAEHELRGLLGLPVEDGTRLIPADAPTLAPYRPDWHVSVNDALRLRPELVLARQDLKFRQLDLINQQNLLMPDLRFTSTYDVNGLGTHLDGGATDPNNAFHSIATNEFHDWSFGLRLTVPIGFRDAHAGVRSARLALAQSYQVLRDQEHKATRLLAEQYQLLFSDYANIEAQRSQRIAQSGLLSGRMRDFQEGREMATLDLVLEAQRFLSDALAGEYAAVVAYNSALARFEFAKGTIMEHDNVLIAEGSLPQCAQVRAVEHERQRSMALVVRERAQVAAHPGGPSPGGSLAGLPELPLRGESPAPLAAGGQPFGYSSTGPDSAAPPQDTPADAPALLPAPGPVGGTPTGDDSRIKPAPAANQPTLPMAAPSADGPGAEDFMPPSPVPARPQGQGSGNLYLDLGLDFASIYLPGIDDLRFRAWQRDCRSAAVSAPSTDP